jgi:hypothetical protein
VAAPAKAAPPAREDRAARQEGPAKAAKQDRLALVAAQAREDRPAEVAKVEPPVRAAKVEPAVELVERAAEPAAKLCSSSSPSFKTKPERTSQAPATSPPSTRA